MLLLTLPDLLVKSAESGNHRFLRYSLGLIHSMMISLRSLADV